MMIDKDFRDIVLNEDQVEEDQVEEDQVEEDQVEEDQVEEQFNVYNLNSTVVQSTSSFFDTALDDLPVLDICCMFIFAVCVFLLFNLFNGGSGNVKFD